MGGDAHPVHPLSRTVFKQSRWSRKSLPLAANSRGPYLPIICGPCPFPMRRCKTHLLVVHRVETGGSYPAGSGSRTRRQCRSVSLLSCPFPSIHAQQCASGLEPPRLACGQASTWDCPNGGKGGNHRVETCGRAEAVPSRRRGAGSRSCGGSAISMPLLSCPSMSYNMRRGLSHRRLSCGQVRAREHPVGGRGGHRPVE